MRTSPWDRPGKLGEPERASSSRRCRPLPTSASMPAPWTTSRRVPALRLRLRAPFVEAIEAHVRRAQLEGRLPVTVDVEVAARALGAMVDNFAQVWFVLEDRPGGDPELDRLAATLALLWNGALGL